MDTQTGGEGETIQAQPATQESPQDYQVDIKPPVETEPPVTAQKPSIQVDSVVDNSVAPEINVANSPEPIDNKKANIPTEEGVGYMDWFSGDVITSEIDKLDIQEPVVEDSLIDTNPLNDISFANEEIPVEDDYSLLNDVSFANPIVDEQAVVEKPVAPVVNIEQVKTKYPNQEIKVSDDGIMTFPKKEVSKPVMSVVKPKTKRATDYLAIEDQVLKYPSKPENDYRVHNGAWQRKVGGSDYWHTITNEGSVNALNKKFNVEVPNVKTYTHPGNPKNEYIIQDGQWQERVKGTYKWTPIANGGRINELNRSTGNNVSIQPKKDLSAIVNDYQRRSGNGLFQSGLNPIEDLGMSANIDDALTKNLGKVIDIQKSTGNDFSQKVLGATNYTSEGTPMIVKGESSLFAKDNFGTKLLTKNDNAYYQEEIDNLEKARQDELAQAKTESQRKQVNDQFNKLIAKEQGNIITGEQYVKSNNDKYWKDVSEKKPNVEKTLTSEEFNSQIHNDNIPIIQGELQDIINSRLGTALDMSNENVQRKYDQVSEFINKDLDVWRNTYGQHLSDSQLEEFKSYQKNLKTRLKDDISQVDFSDMISMTNGINAISEQFEKTKEINNEINSANLEGKSISEYQLEKKKEVASYISGENEFLSRGKDLFNVTTAMHDFLSPYIKEGKITEGKNGVFVVSPNVSEDDKLYLSTKISQFVNEYEKVKTQGYNTLQDDISKLNSQKSKYLLINNQLKSKLKEMDPTDPEFEAYRKKLDASNNNISKIDDQLYQLKNSNRGFFLTEPKKLAQSITDFADESSAKSIFSAVDKSLTPKQQFDAFYRNLWEENDKLSRNFDIDKGGLNSKLDRLKSWTDWEALGFSLTPEEKKYYANKKILYSLSPMYFNNENGITERSASFFESFMNSVQQGLWGDVAAGGGWMNQTDVARTQLQKLNELGYTKEDLQNPINLKDLEERTNVSWASSEFAGQTIGTTATIVADIVISEAINPLLILKAPSIANKLGKVGDFKNVTKLLSNYESKLVTSTKYGKYLTEAVKTGVQFKKAGLIFGSAEEELNFTSGFLGSLGGTAASQFFSKVTPSQIIPTVTSVFGENSDKAIAVFQKIGNSINRGIGETGEEFSQELVSIYNSTLNSRGFWEEFDNRFSSLDDVAKFVISSMVMGGGMGFAQPNVTMELYNSMDVETKSQVDAVVSEVRKDKSNAENELEAVMDKGIEIENTKAEIEKGKTKDKTDKTTEQEQAPVVEVVEPVVSIENKSEQVVEETNISDDIEALDTLKQDETNIIEDGKEAGSTEANKGTDEIRSSEEIGSIIPEEKGKRKVTPYSQRKTDRNKAIDVEVNNVTDHVEQAIIKGDAKISKKAVEEFFGNKRDKKTTGEKIALKTILDPKSEESIDEITHKLWESRPDSLEDVTTREYRDAVENILLNFNGKRKMTIDFVNRLGKTDAEINDEYSQWVMSNTDPDIYNEADHAFDYMTDEEIQSIFDDETKAEEFVNSDRYSKISDENISQEIMGGNKESETTSEVKDVPQTFLAPVQKGQPARKMEKVDGVWMLNENGEMKPVSESIQNQSEIQFVSEEKAKQERKEKSKGLDSKILQKIYDELDSLKIGKNNAYTLSFPPVIWNAVIEAAKAFVKAGDSVNTAIRKASNQILSKAVEDGIITEQESVDAQKGILEKTKPISRRRTMSESINETVGIDTPRQARDKKSKIIDTIRELGGDPKKSGVAINKKTDDIRKMIKEYAEENLSLTELNSTEIKGIMSRLVKAKSVKDLNEAFTKIDDMASKQEENARALTTKSISDKLKDKNLTVKSGNNKKGKLTVEQFTALKTYVEALGDIEGKTLEQLQEIEDTIDGIIKEGRINQKAIDEAKSLRRKRDRAIIFEGIAKRNNREVKELNSINDIENFFDSAGEKVVIIDGHEVSSKTQARALIENNKNLNVKGSKGYYKSNIRNIDYSKTKTRSFFERMNPLSAAKNINSLFAKVYFKAGEDVKKLMKEKFIDPVAKAVHDKREGTMNKKKFINDKLASIFGSEKQATKTLLQDATVQANKSISNEGGRITNDHMVDYYNIARMEGYPERLNKSGVDVDEVNAYINANPKLKAWADFLMD